MARFGRLLWAGFSASAPVTSYTYIAASNHLATHFPIFAGRAWEIAICYRPLLVQQITRRSSATQ